MSRLEKILVSPVLTFILLALVVWAVYNFVCNL